jgi:hypothetical protein
MIVDEMVPYTLAFRREEARPVNVAKRKKEKEKPGRGLSKSQVRLQSELDGHENRSLAKEMDMNKAT